VGRGKLRAGDVRGILASRDRAEAGELAPPHGLTLWQVRY
jgi:tRNA pseudouridine38-40 synthase